MANRAIIGNVVLGLGVIGLGALVVAERNGALARRVAEAEAPPAAISAAPSERPREAILSGESSPEAAPPASGTAPAPAAPSTAPTASAGASTGASTSAATASSSSVSAGTSTDTSAALRPAPSVPAAPAETASASPAPASARTPAADIDADDEAEHAHGAPAVASAPALRPEPEPMTDDELGCDAPAATAAREPSAATPQKASFAASGAAKALLAAIPAAKLDLAVVKRGDTLLSLARAHKVSIGLIRRLNGLAGDGIKAGATLAIPQGPFTASVDRASFALSIELDGASVKKYAVGIGRDGSTPTGSFEVRSRVEQPDWTSPEGDYFKSGDPLNPLGSRWLGFGEGGYGIHGTTDPTSIGRDASRGCVRMNAGDVEEVYDFLTIGSRVTIN